MENDNNVGEIIVSEVNHDNRRSTEDIPRIRDEVIGGEEGDISIPVREDANERGNLLSRKNSEIDVDRKRVAGGKTRRNSMRRKSMSKGRRNSMRRKSMNGGRRNSVGHHRPSRRNSIQRANNRRRMSMIQRQLNKKQKRRKKKRKKHIERGFYDRRTLIRFLEADDVDIDDAMDWLREERGLDEEGNIQWKSKDKSWSQNLVFFGKAAPPPPQPRPRGAGVCQFKGEDEEGNLYVCNNDCIRNRKTKALQNFCGWHMPTCVHQHLPGRTGIVRHPNKYGLCDSHHISIRGMIPKNVDPLDTPGVVMIYENTESYMSYGEDDAGMEDEDWLFGAEDEDIVNGEDDRCPIVTSPSMLKEEESDRRATKVVNLSDVGSLAIPTAGTSAAPAASSPSSRSRAMTTSIQSLASFSTAISGASSFRSREASVSGSPSSFSRKRGKSRRQIRLTRNITARRRQMAKQRAMKKRRGLIGRLMWRVRYYRGRSSAAIVVQRLYRGYCVRKGYRKIQAVIEQHSREDHAVMINKHIRGYLTRLRYRKYKNLVTEKAYFVQDRMKRFVFRRKKLKQSSASLIQRVYRGHRGREVARIERYRLTNMRMYDVEQRCALKVQTYVRMRQLRRSYLRTIRILRREDAASRAIQKCWCAFWSRTQFARRIRELRDAATLIQKRFRVLHGMRIAIKKRRRMTAASLVIQRVFRGSRSRRLAAKERIEILRAWNWLRPYHADLSDENMWGTGYLHRDLKNKTRNQVRLMGIAYPEVRRAITAHQTLRDAVRKGNATKIASAIASARSNGIVSDDLRRADHLKSRLESFDHLLPRSKYLEKPHTMSRLVSSKYNMGLSMDDLMRAADTPMPAKKFRLRASSETTSPRLCKSIHRHHVKTLEEAKREVNLVSRFFVSKKKKEITLAPLPQPLWRAVSPTRPKSTRRRTVGFARTLESASKRTHVSTSPVRLRPIEKKTSTRTDNAVTFDDEARSPVVDSTFPQMRRVLRVARNASHVQQEILSAKHSGGISSDPFDPNVPVPIVRRGRFKRIIDAGSEYVRQLRILSDPSVSMDKKRFTQHVYDSFVFLDKHWERILKDLNAGTLHADIHIDSEERVSYLAHAKPMCELALQAEKWLREMGFHRRRLAEDAGYNLALFNQTKNEDLPLILESAHLNSPRTESKDTEDPRSRSSVSYVNVLRPLREEGADRPGGLDFSPKRQSTRKKFIEPLATSPPHGLGLSPKSNDVSRRKRFGHSSTSPPHGLGLSPKGIRSLSRRTMRTASFHSSGKYSKTSSSKYAHNSPILCNATPVDDLLRSSWPSNAPWAVKSTESGS